MGKFHQFYLLLWKNFILQKRRPIGTFVELFLPVLFAVLLMIIRTQVSTTDHPNVTSWSEFSVDNLPPFKSDILPDDSTWVVVYTPGNNADIEKIMSHAESFLNKIPKSRLERKCPGVAFLKTQMRSAPEEEDTDVESTTPRRGSGMNGAAVGDLPMLVGSLSQMFGRMSMLGAMSAMADLPDDFRELINEKVRERNESLLSFMGKALRNGTMESFVQNVMEEYMNKTVECVLGELDPTIREGMAMISGDNSNTTMETSDDKMSMMTRLLDYFGTVPKVKVLGLPTQGAFVEYMKNDSNLAKTLSGIVFTEVGTNNQFNYSIRMHADPVNVDSTQSRISGDPDTWETNNLFPRFQVIGPRSSRDIHGGKPGYFREGFLSLMHAVDMGIVATFANGSSVDMARNTLSLKRFPYPPYVQDPFLIAIQRIIPMLLLLSFLYTSLTIVKSIVHEKETKMKEYLMMTGLPNWLHWLAWFIKYIIFLSISCIFITIFYKLKTNTGTVLTYSDPTVIFFFLVVYSAATITFCFMVSVFFSKANVAAAAGGVLFGLSYMPYLFIANRYAQMNQVEKSLSCLLSNVAMANGAQLFSMFEGKGTGVQWWNIAEPVSVDDNFTFLSVIMLLLFDCVIYTTIACYVEGVWPGEYGIPKPWYFPFTRNYWLGPRKTKDLTYEVVPAGGRSENDILNPSSGVVNGPNSGEDSEYFEADSPNLRKIVEILDLRKIFNPGPKEKVAVDGLNLDMYEGQITVLLGHNGAGKTTTMSILTGLFPSSSGKVMVMGHDISTHIEQARKSMGLCPQHNILFDQLTVDEHLYFFSSLKGLSGKEADVEIEHMCQVLQLTDKHKAQSSTLSGGMKRKLSVGIALCAGSKFIVLDEPTAGMDPAARRAIWDVLQQYRDKCSMLLSTHFMDEADLLGDRISIMADGKLRCAGSSVFLKNKFGVGYHVVLTKTPECSISKVDDFFRLHIPDSRMERTSGAEISFLLPFESSNLFQNLFTKLDESKESLGIQSYGASITTMEEVFLCVTEDVQDTVRVASRRLSFGGQDEKPPPLTSNLSLTSHDLLESPEPPNTGVALWLQQFLALVIKRILHSRRNLKVIISQLLIPVVFVIIAIINAEYAPFLQENKKLDLSLNGYGNTRVVYNYSSLAEELATMYSDQFTGIADTQLLPSGFSDVQDYLVKEYEEEGGTFNQGNIIAASFLDGNASSKQTTTAWFNNQAYHSPANTLLYADQAFIRWKLNNTNFSLGVSNDPLPRNSSNRIQEQLIGSISGFMIAFNVVLGFSFLAASFSIFLVRERTDRASLLQTLAGVDPICFWMSGFMWDFVNFFLPCLVCIIMFVCFGVTEYIDGGRVWITLLLLALYCWSALPLTYLLSLRFTIPATALVTITILGAIMGLATIITINVLMIIDEHSRSVGETLDWVFLILPQYCIGQGLADLYTNNKMVNICTTSVEMEFICEASGITFQTNYLAWERYGVGRFAVFMALEGMAFFLILFGIEYDVHRVGMKLYEFVRKKVTSTVTFTEESRNLFQDDDVTKEQNRIADSSFDQLISSDLLFLKDLRKVYRGRKGGLVKSLVAVDNLSVGIPRGECFGLLGINGAGKTTTFKMLTGDVRPTSGTAFLDGFNVMGSLKMAQQKMGYCPQFDALIEQMTGRETLLMYGRLRGIREQHVSKLVEKLANLLHFEQYIDKLCGTYSGGNKRKLSTAIALIGGPPVVLLDEPSTGMDPGARRKLWDTISQICTSRRCVIITSHSMEECEALCTRLAIMVNGQLRCLGGPQHLKNKFGQGYSVEVKMASNEDDPTGVKDFVLNKFPGTIIKDEHQGLVAFQVPQTRPGGENLSLAIIFGSMEEAKQKFGLRDYSVSQTTLEQVFLSFARRQREADDN